MFSGLVAYLGRVQRLRGDAASGLRLAVRAPDALAEGVSAKDSIAVNGVCLTVAAHDASIMEFDVVPETLARSTFGRLAIDAPVNVELSLRVGDRLGGHLVYGHVDATAEILDKRPEGQGHRLTVATPAAIAALIVEKGYVTLDGVSLTVASIAPGRFTIALIPETSQRTTLGEKGAGDRLNVEVDPIARYAQAAVAAYANDAGASSAELAWAYEI